MFHWPSNVGGADTRMVDLVRLLSNKYEITVVPNWDNQLNQVGWVNFLNSLNIKIKRWSELPNKADGVAIAFCNFHLFDDYSKIQKIHDMGLRFIWSNDMMWVNGSEVNAINDGLVDTILYTSQFHKDTISKHFRSSNNLREIIIENYIDSDQYKPSIKESVNMIGKLARDDTAKYSEGFPVFYSSMFPDANYKIMAWSDELASKYSWFNFNNKWKFLKCGEVSNTSFLSDIDVYLYDCNHTFIENQSRAIIEAKLMGIPIIAPNKWNFPRMVVHGYDGFLWNTFEDCKLCCKLISNHIREFSINSIKVDKSIFCDKRYHLDRWSKILR
jgi:glycosyltransferase involved in cell wall biosynthesis